MSTAEILSLISTISFVIAAISLVLAVFFWFFFKIPSVIGDLSGRTAKKSIAKMRYANEKAGGQGYKPSAANASRGKLTDIIQQSGNPAAAAKKQTTAPTKKQTTAPNKTKATASTKKTTGDDPIPETGLLAVNKVETVSEQQTELLGDAGSTSLLVDEDATVPLNEEISPPVKRTGGKKLTMLDEVVLIHTDEVI